MHLQQYSTPSSKTATTKVTQEKPLPANQDRVWLILYNPGNVKVSVFLDSTSTSSFALDPGEKMVMPSPVYFGPVTVTLGELVATELLIL